MQKLLEKVHFRMNSFYDVHIVTTSIITTNTVLYKIMLAWVLEQSPQEPKFLNYS